MTLNYFYGNQSDQFTFYRIPKVLFTDPGLKPISVEAKILYGLLLDRMSLSAANGWLDSKGRVYIIYTVEEMMQQLGCAEQKATRLLSELEKTVGLIERKRQGLGRPNLIYVKNFVDGSGAGQIHLRKSQILNCENHNSGTVKTETLDFPKSQTNYTEKSSNTDFNDTDPFSSVHGQRKPESKGSDAMAEYELYQNLIESNLEFEDLKEAHPCDIEMLDDIVHIILDTVCSSRKLIRVAGDDKPKDIVKGIFLKLTREHIEYVLECMKANTSQIRNIRQYLLATLYNAPMTMNSYYEAQVNHDMANKEYGTKIQENTCATLN